MTYERLTEAELRAAAERLRDSAATVVGDADPMAREDLLEAARLLEEVVGSQEARHERLMDLTAELFITRSDKHTLAASLARVRLEVGRLQAELEAHG